MPSIPPSLVPIVYLPGGGGRAGFWRPVADRLSSCGPPIVFGYPGFGDAPANPEFHSLSDLYDSLLTILPDRFHVVAQSMGNVIALRVAIEQPQRVAKLVLCAVTGGVDVRRLGGEEWRVELAHEQPSSPTWFIDDSTDFSDRLAEIEIQTLILSGDADPLSPISVGEFLRDRITHSQLSVISGGTHSMACERPDHIASLIGQFLGVGRA